ncbi:hypothetical protein C8R45DRAFT_436541 [Mycena sanguinolenta]|nr:hypothetical protein C8R45DRAFT_436541 [Mycena sanguinolenta]
MGGLNDVSYFLGLWFRTATWDSAIFQEVMIGAGGTRTDLAALVVSRIKHFVPHPDSPVTEHTCFHLIGVFSLVASESFTGHKDHAFRDALLSSDIVAALITASRALCRSTQPGAEFPLKVVFPALIDQLSSFPTIWLPEALRGGLLEILFECENRNAFAPVLISLLDDILYPATVYHSVLLQLQNSLPQVRDRDVAVIFGDPDLLARWRGLSEVVANRFRFLEQYNTWGLRATRACDDIEGAKICGKRDLKRCSGCSATCYCSLACQANDWRRGGHRGSCADLALSRKCQSLHNLHTEATLDGDVSARPGTSRDRSFLCALVHHEYTTRREEIAQKHLHFIMQHHPGTTALTLFDFTKGTCVVSVGAFEDLRILLNVDVARMIRCGGQTQLMKVLDGGLAASRIWPFPLLLCSSPLPQEPHLLWGPEEYFAKIQALMNSKVQVGLVICFFIAQL